jgi:hypothetical protein
VIGSVQAFGPGGGPRAFAFMPDAARLAAAAPADSAFHVFRLEPGALAHAESCRQRFSSIAAVCQAGGPLLLTAWRDSSIRLWSVARAPALLYRTAPHLTSIVDVEANAAARIIASVDKNRTCALSMLHSGKLLRSFPVDGDDAIRRIAVFNAGWVAVLAQAEAPDARAVVVRAFGVDGRKVGEARIGGEAKEWAKAEWACALNCIVVALAGGRVVFLRLPTLPVVAEFVADVQIVALSFCRSSDSFVVAAADGSIWTLAT